MATIESEEPCENATVHVEGPREDGGAGKGCVEALCTAMMDPTTFLSLTDKQLVRPDVPYGPMNCCTGP